MFAQRHLNFPLSQRTVLVTVDMVRAVRGVDADSVFAAVDNGNLKWVFDVAPEINSADRKVRELRFWAAEIIGPEFVAKLSIAEAIKSILGEHRQEWRGTQIEQLLLVSRPTVMRLNHSGNLPGEIIKGALRVGRPQLEQFFAMSLQKATGRTE